MMNDDTELDNNYVSMVMAVLAIACPQLQKPLFFDLNRALAAIIHSACM